MVTAPYIDADDAVFLALVLERVAAQLSEAAAADGPHLVALDGVAVRHYRCAVAPAVSDDDDRRVILLYTDEVQG